MGLLVIIMAERYSLFVYVEDQDVLYEICGYVVKRVLGLDASGVLST